MLVSLIIEYLYTDVQDIKWRGADNLSARGRKTEQTKTDFSDFYKSG